MTSVTLIQEFNGLRVLAHAGISGDGTRLSHWRFQIVLQDWRPDDLPMLKSSLAEVIDIGESLQRRALQELER